MEKKLNKKAKISIIVVAVIVVIMLTIYLFARSYIYKMNLVSTKSKGEVQTEIEPSDTLTDVSLTDELEDPEAIDPEELTDEPDSPQEEIDLLEQQIIQNMESHSEAIKYDKDVFNILLIGSDTRTTGKAGRSDAMILVSLNKKSKKIIATSFLRDIYLQIPGYKNNRINASFQFGGADLLMKTIETNFRIKVDHFASVDFYAFIDMVDAVGGVELEVTEKEIPIINRSIDELTYLQGETGATDRLTSPGTLNLNGKQALGYARNRYIGMDFERTARQRRVLEQVFSKVKTLNIFELNKLLNAMLPQVTTNLSEGEIFSLMLGLPGYIGYDLEQSRVPVDGTYSFMTIRRMSVIGVDFEKNIEALHDNIYGTSTKE